MLVFTSQESTKASRKSRKSRASELYSSIDTAEEKILETELNFEAYVRDGADTSLLQSRHIDVPNVQRSDHMQRLEEVSEKLKVRRRKGGSVVL